jgi:hypothetical protein
MINQKLASFQITVENRDYHHLSQSEIGGGKRISRHLSKDESRLIDIQTLWKESVRQDFLNIDAFLGRYQLTQSLKNIPLG